jgi:hypothetical protein
MFQVPPGALQTPGRKLQMKRLRLMFAAALLVGAAVCAYAQVQEPPQSQQQVLYGRGRGGIPFAWNDLNRDGICDLTGQPVGQHPIGFGRGQGRWAAFGRFATGTVPTPSGQTDTQTPTIYGRGRGGIPFAWNDLDRDGVCDVTGQPIGQRPIGLRGGRGRQVAAWPAGRGAVGFRGGRSGRGWRWR